MLSISCKLQQFIVPAPRKLMVLYTYIYIYTYTFIHIFICISTCAYIYIYIFFFLALHVLPLKFTVPEESQNICISWTPLFKTSDPLKPQNIITKRVWNRCFLNLCDLNIIHFIFQISIANCLRITQPQALCSHWTFAQRAKQRTRLQDSLWNVFLQHEFFLRDAILFTLTSS